VRSEGPGAVAVLVAVVVGELGGEDAGLRDFGVVELGGTNEGADDTLEAREAEPDDSACGGCRSDRRLQHVQQL
jgi:hypothetical protein